MKDFFKQIGIGIIMLIGLLITVLAIAVVWFCVVIYSFIQWVITYDGTSKRKEPAEILVTNYKEFIKKHPVVHDPKLEAEFDKAFSVKPFPKPYSPEDNPMYQTFDDCASQDEVLRNRVVKDSKKPKYNLRGAGGRFIKRPVVVEPVRTPVTRYGASPMERFK